MKKENVGKQFAESFADGTQRNEKKSFKYLTIIEHFDTVEECANALATAVNFVRGEIVPSRTGVGFDVTWIENVCNE